MQFLEWSIVGLRSARHVFRHDDRDVTVTLFPMLHLGEAAFYEAVYADAAAHDVVVLEGVNSRIGTRLTRAYRWIRPARLGLVVQPKFPRDRAKTIHADVSGEVFDAQWRKAPRALRWLIEGAAGVMGLWKGFTATRASIGKSYNTNDRRSRDAILAWDERMDPILRALLTERDEVLCRSVLEASKDGRTRSIAVIYGAGHMGALRTALTKDGFYPVDSQWMTVFAA